MKVAIIHFHNGVQDGEELSGFDAISISIEMRAIRALLKWHDAVIVDYSLPPEELLGRTDTSNEQRIILAEHHQTPVRASILLSVLEQHFEVSGDAYPKIHVFNSDAGEVRDFLFAFDLEKELRSGSFYAAALRMGDV